MNTPIKQPVGLRLRQSPWNSLTHLVGERTSVPRSVKQSSPIRADAKGDSNALKRTSHPYPEGSDERASIIKIEHFRWQSRLQVSLEFPNVNKLMKLVNNCIEDHEFLINFKQTDKYHVLSTMISQHRYFDRLLDYVFDWDNANSCRSVIEPPARQLISVIQYLIEYRMNIIKSYIDKQGVTEESYSHFDCVYYIFASLDEFKKRLESVIDGKKLLAEIGSFYSGISDIYYSLEHILKSDEMYKKNPKLLLAA